MYRVILSFYLLVPSTLTDLTEPPDPQNKEFDENSFCFFSYNGKLLPKNYVDIPMGVEPHGDVGGAKLEKYRLDFAVGVPGVALTVVSDDKECVLGTTYRFQKSSFDGVRLTNNYVGDRSFFEVKVTVNKDGKKQTLICCTVEANDKPPKEKKIPIPERRKPQQDYIDLITKTFEAANLPPNYIENFKAFVRAT